MRKKFFAIYALAGALVASPVFTSCVDDAESPSVTNIRNEKANQLKALAALQTAQAEAAKIQANADAAYKAAQAAYYEAMAAADQAEAAYQAEMLKQAQEKFVIELEQIKAQAEQQIAYAKLQAMKNQAAIADFENEELKSLYYELQGAIAELNNLNEQKLSTTNWYNQAKEGLVNTEAQKDYYVKYYDKKIAQEEFKIATYEKYEGADIQKLKNDLTIAEKEMAKLQEAVIPYQEAANKAWDAYYEKQNAYWDNNNGFSIWDENVKELAILDIIKPIRQSWSSWWEGNMEISTREMVTEDNMLMPNGNSITYYTFNKTMTDLVKARYALDIDQQKDQIGTPAVAATETTAAVEATGMYRDIEYYKERIAALKKNIEDNKAALEENPDETWRNDDIYWNEQEITNNENYLAQAEFRIEAAKVELANREEKLAKVEALEAAFAADSEEMVAYQAAIDAHKALAEAQATAKEAAEKADEDVQAAWDKYNEKQDERNVLNNKINNSADVEQIIADCERNINNYKSYKQSWLNDVANGETNIAVYEAELAKIEQQIAAQEAIIAGLQAEIDSLTAEEEV